MVHCRDQLAVTAVVGNRGRRLPGLRLRAGDGVGGRVLQTGRPVVVESYANEPFARHLIELSANEEGIGAAAGIPVSFGGEIHGVLHVCRRTTRAFRSSTIDALVRLCTYAGAALAAARDRTRVEEIAASRERRRLARALHDEFGQRLFSIGLAIRNTKSSALTGGDDLVSRLNSLEHELAMTSAAFRDTLKTLSRPPASSGVVVVSIREDAAAFTERTGVHAHVIVMGETSPLDETREELLRRTVQEALRNVERHARATEVVITLAFGSDGSIELVIQDDGVGPSLAAAGMGTTALRGEYERLGGRLELRRAEDTGATFRGNLPA